MMLFKHLVNFLLNTCYHLNVTNITPESQMSGKLGLDLTFNCHFHVKIMRFSTELLLMFAWLVCHNEIRTNLSYPSTPSIKIEYNFGNLLMFC